MLPRLGPARPAHSFTALSKSPQSVCAPFRAPQCRIHQKQRQQQHAVLLDVAAQQAADAAPFSLVAWVVVGTATAASLFYMAQAFREAKTAIDRREEGAQAKQQEDDDAEAARKQKIKDMFERL